MPSAKKRPFQPEDYFVLRNVTDPQLSPNGKRVAYAVSWPDKESDSMRSSIYVADLNGRATPRRFTHGERDHSPRWSPDGRYLAFVSSRQEKNQVFLAPLDGGDPRQLTNSPFGASRPAWSPDGSRIAFIARAGKYQEPKDRKGAERNAPRVIRDLRFRLDGVGYFDERRTHIFVIEVEGGEEQQITDGDWYDDMPSWSPDGRWIAFSSDRRSDCWAVLSSGGRARRVSRAKGSAWAPQFSPDGRSLAYIGHEHGEAGSAKNSHVFIVPFSGGAPQSLSASLDRSVAGGLLATGQTLAWSRDGKAVYFLVSDRGTVALYRTGIQNGSVSKVMGGDRQIDGFAVTHDDERTVFTAAWPSEPPEVYVAPVNGGRARMVSDANTDARKRFELSSLRRMSYTAADGWPIETLVMLPPGYRAGRRYPTFLYIHGGPHSYHPMATPAVIAHHQAFAAAGYVVLLPNPRGSQGYGEEFAHAVVGDWAGKDYEDLLAATDLLIRRGIADPDRLYVGGGSYGGFMTQWAVGHTDRFRAAVVAAPVSEHVSMFGTTDIPKFSIYEHGGHPWEIEDVLRERSPATYLPEVKTPVLLLHWEGDLRCPIEQSEIIFQGLKTLGKKVEFVRYPGGFHTVRTPSQEIDRVRRMIAWYNAHRPRGARKRAARVAAPSNGRRNGRVKAATRRKRVPSKAR
jgi:dipeptidyl aminopeptidase/acylaminoacyl peptidase